MCRLMCPAMRGFIAATSTVMEAMQQVNRTGPLLQLTQSLLSHSSLSSETQLAWAVATQHFAGVNCCFQLSAALDLMLAIGQCCGLSEVLQQQLVKLTQEHQLLDVLIDRIDSTIAAQHHGTTAAIIMAVRTLALLQPAVGTESVNSLSKVWHNPQHLHRLLQAACNSPAAAEAVAALAVTAASLELPAASLLHGLLLPAPKQSIGPGAAAAAASASSSSSTSSCSRKAWVAVALQPLLQQIQHWQLQQTTAAAAAAAAAASTSTKGDAGRDLDWVSQQQHQHSVLQCAGSQQLWLLLCMAMQVADGQLVSNEVLHTLEQVFSDPAVTRVLQAILLVQSESMGHGVAAAAEAPSGTHSARLKAPTLQLLSRVAGHSASLAQHCFNSLAPVLPEVLLACQPGSSTMYASLAAAQSGGGTDAPTSTPTRQGAMAHQGDAAAAAAAAQAEGGEVRPAVLRLWQQLLLKGRSSFPGALHALLQEWLPIAAGALAAAAVPVQQGSAQSQLCNRAAAFAAAFVPLASEVHAPSKPLVCLGGPGGMVQMLTPHVPALVQLMQRATSRPVSLRAPAAAAASVGSTPSAAVAASCYVDDGWVLMMAIWLLQSWVAALQQPQQQVRSMLAPSGSSSTPPTQRESRQPQGVAQHLGAAAEPSAASILAALQPQMLAAVAAIVAAGGSSTLQVRCQTKGLDLARVLLSCQPACQADMLPAATTSSSSSSGCGSCPVSSFNVTAVGKDLKMEGGDSSAAAAAADVTGLLLAALGALFARSPKDPMSLARRQLLQTACLLLADLAQQQVPPRSALQAAAVAPAQGTVSAAVLCPAAVGAAASNTAPMQQQQHEDVWRGLYRDLRVLHEDLVTRKLARSSSREELLQAVSDALELLGKLGFTT